MTYIFSHHCAFLGRNEKSLPDSENVRLVPEEFPLVAPIIFKAEKILKIHIIVNETKKAFLFSDNSTNTTCDLSLVEFF